MERFQASPVDFSEDLRECFEESFTLLTPYLNKIHYLDANLIYLHLYCKAPKPVLADIFRLGEDRITRRISRGIKHLGKVLQKPTLDNNVVREEFSLIFPPSYVERLVMYYELENVRVAVKVLGVNYMPFIFRAIGTLRRVLEQKDLKSAEQVIYRSLKHKVDLSKRFKSFDEFYDIYIRYLNYFDKIREKSFKFDA